MFQTNDPRYKDLRRKLRQKQTTPEWVLWQLLKNKQTGYKFYRQYGIHRYIVDFCCPEKSLVIELDGGHHAQEENKEYDKERTYELKVMGFKVIRFWNSDVLKNTNGVYQKILEHLEK